MARLCCTICVVAVSHQNRCASTLPNTATPQQLNERLAGFFPVLPLLWLHTKAAGTRVSPPRTMTLRFTQISLLHRRRRRRKLIGEMDTRRSTPPSSIHSPGTQSHSRRGRKRLTPNRCIRRQIVIVGCSHEIEVTVARGAARWRERKCSDGKLHGGFTYSIRGLGERWMSHIASAAY